MRRIQSAFPDVTFDWPQLLKGRQEPPPAERARPEPGGRGERAARPGDRPERREPREQTDRGARRERTERAPRPERIQTEPATPVTPEPPAASAQAEPASPAEARLGAAGLRRLRARFIDILARIKDRVEDDSRRAELNAAAERLNPDGWATDEDVLAGIESYEASFEALKTAIGGRRQTSEPAPPEPAGPVHGDEAH